MWLLEHVLEETELVEQVRRARLQHLATELTLESPVAFEDQNPSAALGEQQTEHQACGPTSDDACVDMNGSHDKATS